MRVAQAWAWACVRGPGWPRGWRRRKKSMLDHSGPPGTHGMDTTPHAGQGVGIKVHPCRNFSYPGVTRGSAGGAHDIVKKVLHGVGVLVRWSAEGEEMRSHLG